MTVPPFLKSHGFESARELSSGKDFALAGLRFHDLRHTAATKLLELGTPIVVVAQILGWSASTAVRMAKHYGHIRPEAQRRALDAVARKK
jgi:integrase